MSTSLCIFGIFFFPGFFAKSFGRCSGQWQGQISPHEACFSLVVVRVSLSCRKETTGCDDQLIIVTSAPGAAFYLSTVAV